MKLLGLIDLDDVELRQNAQHHIQQWTNDLLEINSTFRNSSSSFASLQKKRIEVQQRLHRAFLREKERLQFSKVFQFWPLKEIYLIFFFLNNRRILILNTMKMKM